MDPVRKLFWRDCAGRWPQNGRRPEIWVNVVCQGLLKTESLDVMPKAEVRVVHEQSASPLGRLVRKEEVAYAVHFLCSRASDGGLVIDGGKRISGLTASNV